jgi:hypothetical protein
MVSREEREDGEEKSRATLSECAAKKRFNSLDLSGLTKNPERGGMIIAPYHTRVFQCRVPIPPKSTNSTPLNRGARLSPRQAFAIGKQRELLNDNDFRLIQ